ncbi:NAD-glutamate dehydrogenase domain-containing protein, partial [Nocardia sp. NPDC003345]
MTVSSELSSDAWVAELPDTLRAGLGALEDGYFRYVGTEDADCEITAPTLTFRAHLALALTRQPGQGLVRAHHPDDGSGLGAAVQIVTDDMPMLVDSVTALFSRMGGTVSEVIHPIVTVERDAAGGLLAARPHEAGRGRNGTAAGRESWIHLQLHPATGVELLAEIAAAVPEVIADVRRVSSDTGAIEDRLSELAAGLDGADAAAAAEADIEPAECARLLRWMADGNFTVLGYIRYRYEPGEQVPVPVAGSGLGVLHPDAGSGFRIPVNTGARPLLRMTQGLVPVTMQRAVHPYFIGVADLDGNGVARGEHLFLGVFTVTALHENVLDIPVVGQRVLSAIEGSGFALDSFSGQAMLEVMQGFPRSELFSSDAATLRRVAGAVLNVGLRRQVRLFVRVDPYGRFVAAMVYLPRDRYTTAVRLEIQDILVRELGGASIDYSARVSESELASVYFTVRMPGADDADPVRGAAEEISEAERLRIQNLLAEATRTWDDHLNDAVSSSTVLDPRIVHRYCEAFPEGYKQDFTAPRALADIDRLERLTPGGIDQHLYRTAGAPTGSWRFTLYIGGGAISLSQVLPVLQSLGVEVLDERPYRIRREPDGRSADQEHWIYDFGLQVSPELLRGAIDQDLDAELLEVAPDTLARTATAARVRDRFTAAFDALWYGRAEADGLNELVLRAGLDWREVAVLRTYAKYLRQAGFPYSQFNIARVLHTYPDTARLFAALFAARFDPDSHSTERCEELEQRVRDRIDEVVSLDADRILRAILGLIRATLRTNYYVTDGGGAVRDFISVKVEPQEITELPQPRPKYEIFVYSPRVEGVHLRFGAVARGG